MATLASLLGGGAGTNPLLDFLSNNSQSLMSAGAGVNPYAQTLSQAMQPAFAAYSGSQEADRKRVTDEEARKIREDYAAGLNLTPPTTPQAGFPRPMPPLPSIPGQQGMVDQSHAAAAGATNQQLAALLPGYLERLAQIESGNNPNAKNPNSSARGIYQATDGTWNDYAPRLGLSPDGRGDPAQEGKFIQAFTADNAAALSKNGIPLSNEALYAAHFLGRGGGPKALAAPDNAPLVDIVGQQVIAANNFPQDMTVGQFKQWLGQKMGGAAPSNSIPQVPQPSAPPMGGQGGGYGMPSTELLKRMLANPITADMGMSLIEQARNAGQGGDPVKGVEINGRLVNPYTGELIGDFSSGGAAGAGRLSTQPQYAIDPATGKIVLGQIGADGSFHRTEMGGLQPYDPVSMAGAKQGAVVDAKTAAAAREALPAAQTAADIALKAIDTLRNDAAGQADQFGRFLGIVPQQWTPALPGTEKADFRVNLEQAGGQAFLQARQMLKGGGQITDFEGRRAEAAYSRMQAAAANGSQQEFQAALDDFEWAVRAGVDKLKEAAAPGGAAVQPGWQDAGDGVRIRVKE